MKSIIFNLISVFLFFSGLRAEAKDYYFHPRIGNDASTGTSIKTPFQSFEKLRELKLEPGDRILLAAGEVFTETLSIENVHGSFGLPILIDSYKIDGSSIKTKAIIDAKGLLNGLIITKSSYLRIRNLDISANGPLNDLGDGSMRVGILLLGQGNEKIENIHIDSIEIHDVFYEKVGISRSEAEVKSANGTQKYGWGIRLVSNGNAEIENVTISNSSIKNVSHTGIKLTGTLRQNIKNVSILENTVERTGGPGIQMSGVKFVFVQGNDVSYSGSTDDSRKWGRGSGLWTWSASHVLIEKNSFMYANGPGDSAGAHIDYNCDNIVLQYNFSAHNAGGFCEILGNNYNCAYRYNISVNDGHRVKGENGAFQEGKIFWLSGYQGDKERKGPINSYFYNNTIYVKAGQVSKVAIDNRSKGILIANNIFHLEGPVELVAGDQYTPDNETVTGELARVFFEHNLFLNESSWPSTLMIQDKNPLFGSADFKMAGGLAPEDYIPSNKRLAEKGLDISMLEGDPFGLMHGLQMKVDFLGNPINENPGMGAILTTDN